MNEIKKLIAAVDLKGIRHLLSENPALANEGISLDDENTTSAHPLHRICDGVFAKKYTDEQAVEMAKVFIEFGANINGNELIEEKDTPLIAASSLQADAVALLCIHHGANIHHAGCHGGTALHWAAWCGRDIVVRRLLLENPDLNKLCIDFKSTPLFWAIHGYKFGGAQNLHHQQDCARMLMEAGADKSIPNFEGYQAVELLDDRDVELMKLLK